MFKFGTPLIKLRPKFLAAITIFYGIGITLSIIIFVFEVLLRKKSRFKHKIM